MLAKTAAPFLQDADPEVRVEAALAQNSPAAVTQGLLCAISAAPDPRLLYQIGMHLGRSGAPAPVLELLRSTNSAWKRAGLIALDTASSENTPLAADIRELDPQVLDEVPPAEFARKLAWFQRHQPELMASELERLESGELQLTPTEALAALTVLEENPKIPAQLLLTSLASSQANLQETALRVVRRSACEPETFLAPTLNLIHSANSVEVRLEAIFALASFGRVVSTDEWIHCLQLPEIELSAASIRALREVEPEPNLAKSILEAAPALIARAPGLRDDLELTLRALGIPTAQCDSLPQKEGPPPIRYELSAAVLARVPKASASLGRLTFHSSRTGCAQCHATRPGQGSPLGPNLSDIGSVSQPEYLLESILEPSKVIKTGFESEIIEMADGRIFTGLVEMEGESLLVKVSPGETVTIPMGDIKKRSPAQLSPMPEGLDAAMSEAELADLVAYLASLRTSP